MKRAPTHRKKETKGRGAMARAYQRTRISETEGGHRRTRAICRAPAAAERNNNNINKAGLEWGTYNNRLPSRSTAGDEVGTSF